MAPSALALPIQGSGKGPRHSVARASWNRHKRERRRGERTGGGLDVVLQQKRRSQFRAASAGDAILLCASQMSRLMISAREGTLGWARRRSSSCFKVAASMPTDTVCSTIAILSKFRLSLNCAASIAGRKTERCSPRDALSGQRHRRPRTPKRCLANCRAGTGAKSGSHTGMVNGRARGMSLLLPFAASALGRDHVGPHAVRGELRASARDRARFDAGACQTHLVGTRTTPQRQAGLTLRRNRGLIRVPSRPRVGTVRFASPVDLPAVT